VLLIRVSENNMDKNILMNLKSSIRFKINPKKEEQLEINKLVEKTSFCNSQSFIHK
jgi:hypothetical protein